METEKLSNFLNQFEGLTKKPEKYICAQEDEAEVIKLLTKDLYNFTKQKEKVSIKSSEVLEELIIADLDEEQIWQQIELQNNSVQDRLVSDVAHLLVKRDNLKFPIEKQTMKDKKKKKDTESMNYDKELREKKVKVTKKAKKRQPKSEKSSIVDDKFFKLHEMEEYLERIEKGEEFKSKDDFEVDYFQDDLTDEEDNDDSDNENKLHYNDFFDQPDDEADDESANEERQAKKVKFDIPNEEHESDSEEEGSKEDLNEEDIGSFDEGEGEFDFSKMENDDEEEEETEGNDENKDDSEDENEDEERNSSKKPSTFEARQERLKRRIKNLEEEALKEKPWQLLGEVTASNRPQNSLLEEYVDFDLATRPAPILTEKSTLKLEDVIMQRIKDKAWDDVVRKFKPVESDLEYKKKLVLDQEKSKLSLAQIYEQEYLKQLDSKNESGLEKEEIEPPEHQEIRLMMNSLFSKLDALSNFHFTPKQVQPEVKIISNLPAITMEEVAPVAASDATLLAPEEIKAKTKGDLIGKSERTTTDKKRERRQKKLHQKLKNKKLELRAKEKLEKSNSKDSNSKKISQKLLQKITKSKNVTQLEESKGSKYIKSSNAFFSKLQSETDSKINKKGLTLNMGKSGKASAKKSKKR